MTTSTLVKTLLHNSVADSVFKEISTKTGRYYYFLGSALEWDDPSAPPVPVDSVDYENKVRQNIILVKEIQASDVAFVVDRINWVSNTVYDEYDDFYSDQLVGINLINGGSGYSANTTVTLSGGGGSGAAASAVITAGAVSAILLNNRGYGYNALPNVTITDSFGTGAIAQAVLNTPVSKPVSGALVLEDALFYVITDEFNIYKCLDNNRGRASTVKPSDVSPEPFVTSDGYKWKFIGNVPISLRNKFLTATQVPVVTSINQQFYSSGEIKTVDVIDTGNNYTYGAITVQGDGYLEEDPYLVVSANVTNGGSSYTYANVTIDPPIASSYTWAANTKYSVGQIVEKNNNYYEVVMEGYSASYPPVHTKSIAKNGNAIFKYRATGITANVVLSSGNVIGLANLYGVVRDVVITDNGSGYTVAPNITIQSSNSNTTATATAFINSGSVNRITITDTGSGYLTAPTVTIGTPWVANASYSLNSQIFYGTQLYTVTTAGYSNTTAPIHTAGTQTLGNAAFAFAGTSATGYARLKYGSGYTRAPNATITGNGSNAVVVFSADKSEAVVYPIIEDGKITRVVIENGGVGYTYATLNVVGDGANADVRVNLSEGDLITPQATSELLAVSGAIHNIKVVSGGYGYTGANVVITGNGTGATANAVIVNGKIVKINMVTEGSGYTQANVSIVAVGTGTGATARAILPPYGGHGKDPVNELYSRSLAFYTIIGQEKNQGFTVTNDYRQFGIIKNVRNYDNNKFFNGLAGSGCWLLSGNINPSLFAEDVTVTRVTDNAKFLIISTSTNGLLAVSLDDRIPVVGDIMSESSGNVFSITGVTKPDIDKYSGEMLYVDNRRAFTTTDDQSVSIKTVFKY